MISTKSSMRGFIVFDYATRYGEGRAYLADMVERGKIKYEYHVLKPGRGEEDGLGQCVGALEDVFSGRNFGKT
jgi:NADPH-dependent curcumin reductase CurA